MMNQINIRFKQILSILLLTACIGHSASAQEEKDAKKLFRALEAICNLYVDPVDNNKVVEDAIRGMLEKLDPHSNYMDPEETRAMNEPLEGKFDGIGIQFNLLTDTLYVIQVIPGGPSEKVGIRPGDRIIQVNDTLIAGVNMKNIDIMKRLRGRRGTKVRVKVLRKNVPSLIDFTITRDKIPMLSLDASYMADKHTGYIKLNRFAASSVNEFKEALLKLRMQGMKNLILDLQGNSGGYLNTSIELADEFLSQGQLIVYTKGHQIPRDQAIASQRGEFQKGRLVVMVDESSASASEIVSGAIQDWDRGVIVGRRTFGKGLVQKPIPLLDGSMMRLTVSRYYTPTGRCIQKPYENGHNEDYKKDMIERYNRGELMSADSIHFPDSLKYSTLVNHRTVYGGGGIMPDIFIPIDTTRYSDYHRDLVANGIIYRFAMNYLDHNREEINSQYGTFSRYKENFQVTDAMMQELIANAEKEKIAFNEEGYERSKELIRLQLKALIARDHFDMGEYFQIINESNPSYNEALRIINDRKAYKKAIGD